MVDLNTDWIQEIKLSMNEDLNIKKKETCEFCRKKFKNLHLHLPYCKLNPNHRLPSQCPHCKRWYIGLEYHLRRCKQCSEVRNALYRGEMIERQKNITLYCSPQLITFIQKPTQTRSSAVREAIKEKLEKENDLNPLKESAKHLSIGITPSLLRKIHKHLEKGYSLSPTEFIRTALIEKYKRGLKHDGD